MKAKKYLVDFDTRVSEDKSTLQLIRNDEVFEQKNGFEAISFLRRLVRIEELVSKGFEYRFLEFDGKLDEWYELVLVSPSVRFDGVTLVYYPEEDCFEIAENGIRFTEMAKAEQMIKSFRI
jgi:hypothetical protein